MLSDFKFSAGHHNDAGITYYVAGYVSRGIMKKTTCKDCRTLLSDNEQELPVSLDDSLASAEDLEAGRSFLAVIN